MLRILVDEDMPRSTGRVLEEHGFAVLDVRDRGLRGKSDEEIFTFASKENAIILTADLGFGNLWRSPPQNSLGILIARFPNELSISELNRQINAALSLLSGDDLRGNLIIIEPGRLRIRRRK